MLTFAITSFFALTGFSALAVIFWMFASYHEKILRVILNQLEKHDLPASPPPAPYRQGRIRVRQPIRSVPARHPAPFAAAA